MRPMIFLLVLGALAVGIGSSLTSPTDASPPPAPPASAALAPDFWGHWGDGKAELSGYALRYPRYGKVRTGTAVTIFVNEEFAESVRVKNEDSSRPASEIYPVMKLNWIQDFPTGIYDYSLMTSAFATLAPHGGRPAGTTTKVSFSSQEWCGHVYAQLLFNDRGANLTSHSYFDGEADQSLTLPHPDGGLPEDSVLLWARGFAGPSLEPGGSTSVPVLRSLERSRLLHIGLGWQTATASRSKESRTLEVPAGTFAVDTYTLAIPAGRAKKSYPLGRGEVDVAASTWTIEVESAWPHRVIRWGRDDGLEAVLVGSDRLPYWSMNGPGFESALEKIGLEARPPRTP